MDFLTGLSFEPQECIYCKVHVTILYIYTFFRISPRVRRSGNSALEIER